LSYSDQAAFDAISRLRDVNLAEPAATFPLDRTRAAAPGLYSWWADDAALRMLSSSLGSVLQPLVYAGQAGATSTRSRKQGKSTLRSRVGGLHIRGNVKSSTFRRTLTAALRQPLRLRVVRPFILDPDDNARLTQWIREHLWVNVQPYADRDTLAEAEAVILAALDPPLNIDGRHKTPLRIRLSALRTALGRPG
jgi:hypothetical protein